MDRTSEKYCKDNYLSSLISLSYHAILNKTKYPIKSSIVSNVFSLIPLLAIRIILSSIQAQIVSTAFPLEKMYAGSVAELP